MKCLKIILFSFIKILVFSIILSIMGFYNFFENNFLNIFLIIGLIIIFIINGYNLEGISNKHYFYTGVFLSCFSVFLILINIIFSNLSYRLFIYLLIIIFSNLLGCFIKIKKRKINSK